MTLPAPPAEGAPASGTVPEAVRVRRPPAFHPAWSPLGRWFRRRAASAWQAESRYLYAAVGLGAALTVLGQWAWLPVRTLDGTDALWAYAAAGAAGVLAFAGLVLVGVAPAITAVVEDEQLTVCQGSLKRTVPLAEVARVRTLSAERFHRGLRRAPGAAVFVTRLPDAVLVLDTAAGPVALGLDTPERARVLEALKTHGVPVTTADSLPRPGGERPPTAT